MGTYDESILTETKRVLGIAEDVNVFDQDVRMHINSAFGTLTQLGLGPVGGFEVEDESQTWADFLVTDLTYSPVKTYVHLRTRLIFDPPPNSWTITAVKDQIEQLEWRLNISREDQLTEPVELPQTDNVLDGGEI